MHKNILILEDAVPLQKMYKKIFAELFPEANLILHDHRLEILDELGMKDLTDTPKKQFDLYILDGQIRGMHTGDLVEKLPREKVVVISGEPEYHEFCDKQQIAFFPKPCFTSFLRESKQFFEDIMNK